jgi:hypothetical protein
VTRVRSLGLVLLACGLLAACGNGAAANNTATSSSSGRVTNESNSNSLPSQPPSATLSEVPAPVNVGSGQEVSGVNITVAPAASTNPPSAEDLGVNPVHGLGMAANTGGSIRRGSTMRILLFGPGLNARMKVTVAGHSDITIGNLQGITATDNTPGIAFMASVSPNAELGARTIFLKSDNGDQTAFAGGLEVVP